MDLDFVAGLIDADGNLSLSLEKSKKSQFGYRRQVILNITNNDKILLQEVKDFLKCGTILSDRKGSTFRVKSYKDAKKLISQFENRVHGSAKVEMPVWKEALFLCENENTKQGFSKFVNLMYGINSQGANRKYPISYWLEIFGGKEDKDYVNMVKEKIVPSMAMVGSYVSGFCQGDGSFYLSNKIRFVTGFSLTDPERNVLEEMKEFLVPGSKCIFDFDPKTTRNNKTCYRLQVDRFELCKKSIVPHFDSFPLFGEKQKKRYLLWREAVFLAPKTSQNFSRIRKICELLKTIK